MATVKAIAFWAFAIAFAIKVPVWPFHTWLPDAHAEAPTAFPRIIKFINDTIIPDYCDERSVLNYAIPQWMENM